MPPLLTDKPTKATAPPIKLSAPQVRILRVLDELMAINLNAVTLPELASASDGELAELANIQRKWITTYVHRACKINRCPALWELGYVTMLHQPVDGQVERRYAITEAGKAALARHSG
jgi:DNA-binding MarR family transcriptional regulator